MEDDLVLKEKGSNPPDGHFDRAAFDRWSIVITNGRTFVGAIVSGSFEKGASFFVMKPVFEVFVIPTPQGMVTNLNFPLGLGSVEELKIPNASVIVPCAGLWGNERQVYVQQIENLLHAKKQMLAAKSGTPMITLARG